MTAAHAPPAEEKRADLRETRPCALQPASFFIAWQGVPSLAFAGFPPTLLDLKARIDAQDLNGIEAPGSKWPKVTLGAVADGATLTLEETAALKALCEELTARDVPPVPVAELRVVRFACRSLERRLREWPAPLAGEPDASPPPEEHRRFVQGVIAEFLGADVPEYYAYVSRAGNREPHYRGTFEGYTLVANLPRGHPVASRVAEFRARADAACPGKFRWFDERALHCTLRALTREGAEALVAELAGGARAPAAPAADGAGAACAD